MLSATEIIKGDVQADDLISLPYADRFKRRIRLTSDTGLEFLLDLPKAAELPEGACLKLDTGQLIRIQAADEDLTEVAPGPKISLARLAWHIGNRHLPCEIHDRFLRIERDKVIEIMLLGLGADLKLFRGPFRPEGGAYGIGRIMGHTH